MLNYILGPNDKIINLTLPNLFKVTGKYYGTTKNFKAIRTSSYERAMNINLWNGRVWALDSDYKWRMIKEVFN